MRRLAFAIAIAFFFSLSLSAQTVDEIITKNIAAHGGMARLKAVQSMRLTGDVDAGEMQAGFSQVFKRPMKMRLDISLQGLTLIQAYDGQNGWQIVPFTGKKDPEMMAADDLKQVQEQADFDGPLVDYKQKGNTVTLVGKEKIDATNAYHLKITMKNGTVRDLFLDASTFLAIKMVAKTTMRGAEAELESKFGNYKEVEGLMFPFLIEQQPVGGEGAKQKITLKKVELNVVVEDSIFKMPVVVPLAAPEKPGPTPAPK